MTQKLVKIGSGIFAGSSLAALAIAAFLAFAPVRANASPNNYSTGTWDPSTTNCTCPTFYAGCKCIVP